MVFSGLGAFFERHSQVLVLFRFLGNVIAQGLPDLHGPLASLLRFFVRPSFLVAFAEHGHDFPNTPIRLADFPLRVWVVTILLRKGLIEGEGLGEERQIFGRGSC